MKKLVIVILFAFFSFAATAQTHTVAADSPTFSIDGKVFNRGAVYIDTPVGSTGMAITSSGSGRVICYMTPYTNYKRANGAAFASRRAFLGFADSFMYYTAGGGVISVTAGTGLTGGTITSSGTIAVTNPILSGSFVAHGDGSTVVFTTTVAAGYSKAMCQISTAQSGSVTYYDVKSSSISGTTLSVSITGNNKTTGALSYLPSDYTVSYIISK